MECEGLDVSDLVDVHVTFLVIPVYLVHGEESMVSIDGTLE